MISFYMTVSIVKAFMHRLFDNLKLCTGKMNWLHTMKNAPVRNGPRYEKTCLRGFRPDKTQTGLRSHRS